MMRTNSTTGEEVVVRCEQWRCRASCRTVLGYEYAPEVLQGCLSAGSRSVCGVVQWWIVLSQ